MSNLAKPDSACTAFIEKLIDVVTNISPYRYPVDIVVLGGMDIRGGMRNLSDAILAVSSSGNTK